MRQADGKTTLELWIPAQDLNDLHANIIGRIQVTHIQRTRLDAHDSSCDTIARRQRAGTVGTRDVMLLIGERSKRNGRSHRAGPPTRSRTAGIDDLASEANTAKAAFAAAAPDPPICSAMPFVISPDGCVQIRPFCSASPHPPEERRAGIGVGRGVRRGRDADDESAAAGLKGTVR